MSEEKTVGQRLTKELFTEWKNVYETMTDEDMTALQGISRDYKNFLNAGRTERLCCGEIQRLLKRAGFVEFNAYKEPYEVGEKFFYNHKGKAIIAGVIGREDLGSGVNIVAAHLDSPRLDLKMNPLYECDELALFKTHYYGGIKKYQWTAIPLALCGVVLTRKGNPVEISIGLDSGDPIFCVTDLLPHLAPDQMSKKATEVVSGEQLNILVGSVPFKDDKASEKVKLNIMSILNQKYGIVEEDFVSAELEMVPAFPARDLGLDRSMIGAYGHDDRVCAFSALRAIIEAQEPVRTALAVFVDKEEIGSMGTTGIRSRFIENLIEDLADMYGVPLRRVLAHSTCLSADVNAAFDPTFPEVSEKRNCARLNGGICLTKYTGSRGKSGSNDANAELMGKVRKLFADSGVVWQIGELGKVDQGGGGTVAQYVANLDVETVDCGVAMLSMHAPYEVVSKADVFMAVKAYRAFFENFK
ncbi:MAG: aminopeptidase [Eubacteriales bacterium]